MGVWEGVTDPVAGALRDALAEGGDEGEGGGEGEPSGVAGGEPESDCDALVEGEPPRAAAATDAEAAALGGAPALPLLLQETEGLTPTLCDRVSKAEGWEAGDGVGAFEAPAVADTLPLPLGGREGAAEALTLALARRDGELLPEGLPVAAAAGEGAQLPLLALDALPVLDGAPLAVPQLLALVVMVVVWEPVGRADALTGMHATLLFAARARWYRPAGQGRHAEALGEPVFGLKVEGGHGVQSASPVLSAKVPTGQAAHSAAPVAGAKVPAPQGWHAVAPVLGEKDPAPQARHAPRLDARVTMLEVPAGQGMQAVGSTPPGVGP